MNQPYLQITYRHGKPLAAYLYFARRDGDRAANSEPVDNRFVVGRAADGHPIGVEIVDPASVSADAVNQLLLSLNQSPLPAADLAPLKAA